MPEIKLTELQQTIKNLTGLGKKLKLQQSIKDLTKGQEFYASRSQAQELGYDIQEGWMLKFTGTDTESLMSLISPDKWEYLPDERLAISPTGERYTQRQMTKLWEQQAEGIEGEEREYIPPEIPSIVPEIERSLSRVYPEYFIELELRRGVPQEQSPYLVLEKVFTEAKEDTEAFLQNLYDKGRSPDTEVILRVLFEGITDEDITMFYTPPDPYAHVRTSIEAVFPNQTPAEIAEWATENQQAFLSTIGDMGLTTNTWNLLRTLYPEASKAEIVDFFASYQPEAPVSKDFLWGIQKGLQYAEGWWKTGLMETGFIFHDALTKFVAKEDEMWNSQAEEILNKAFMEHGWKAIFTTKVNEAWDIYFKERDAHPALGIVAEMANPVWYIASGGTAQLLARPFAKIPILGKTMKTLADAVLLAEMTAIRMTGIPAAARVIKRGIKRALYAPITAELTPQTKVIAQRYLLSELPTRDVLRAWLFKNDAFRRFFMKVPFIRKLCPVMAVDANLPKVLATRIEVQAAVIQEAAMRNAIIEIGQSQKGQGLAYLRELGTTKELLGVKGGLCNPKLVQARFKGESLALGDVVQAPERYYFANPNGFNYCKRAQTLTREMWELAAKMDVSIIKTQLPDFKEYVHWVCTGVVDKNGVVQVFRQGGRAVGALPSSVKTRMFENMGEGIKAGYIYADDLEIYVATYIDDVFKLVADKQLGIGLTEIVAKMSKELGALPVLPLARLEKLYPDIARKWWLRPISKRIGELSIREIVADLGYSVSAARLGSRYGSVSPQVLNAIRMRTPAIYQRFQLALSFKGDKSSQAKLVELIWGRMKVGKSIPVTLENKRVVVQAYVNTLNKTQVRDIYQQFRKLDKLDDLFRSLDAELQKLIPEWRLARMERALYMQKAMRPRPRYDEGFILTPRGFVHPLFNRQIYPKYIADNMTRMINEQVNSFLKLSAQYSGAFRLQQAALDISAGMIQGFVAMASHPTAWKAQLWAIRALAQPKTFQRFLVQHAMSINQRNFYLGAQRPFEYFEQMGLLQRIFGKAPYGKIILNQTYGRAEAAFSMWSTYYKTLMWEAQAPRWIKAGQGAEFARYLDRMTGMMSFRQLGMPANARAFLSGWVSFAPQYRFSVIAYFADAFKGGMTGAMVRADIAKMIAAVTVMYVGFCEVTGNKPYLNPHKDGKKFLSINIDGHWIGLGSAVVSMMRAYIDIAASALSVGENEPMDFLVADKWKNPLLRALMMQGAVLPQQILEIATRRDFMGYPLGDPIEDEDARWAWAKWVGGEFTPFWLHDILYDRSGVPYSPLAAAGEFAGLRTSPQTRWETLDDMLRAEKAWEAVDDLTDEQAEKIEDGESVMSVLQKHQEAVMFDAHPDIAPFYEEAWADALIRQSQLYKDYTRGMNTARIDAITGLEKALDVGIKIEGEDARYLRERYNKIMGDYGVIVGTIMEAEIFAPIIDEIEEGREKRKPEAELVDLAYWDFMETVVAPDREKDDGDFDYEEYQEALSMWREKWGEDMYSKILYITKHNKEWGYYIEGKRYSYPDWAIKIWEDKLAITDGGYWDLPIKPIYQMKEKDKEDELIPEEYLSLWEEYQAIKTVEGRERFEEQYPEFTKDWRMLFRAEHPEVDAMLALWGYGGQLQSREAYDNVVKWSEELGIPLEQVGLALPPQNIIDDYFEHQALLKEFSPNSAQVRLFKLGHPDYLAWGITEKGWDELLGESKKILTIQVNWADEIAEYDAVGNRFSEEYIPDDKERALWRADYNASHTDFRDDMRRMVVYKTGVDDIFITATFVEYSIVVDEHGAASAEAMLYRFDHNKLNEWGTSEEIRDTDAWADLEVERVPIWRIDAKFRKEDEEYQAILDKYIKAKEQTVATDAYLAEHPEYNIARYERRAYEVGLPKELIPDYVDYYTFEPTTEYDKRWFLQDHPEFYQAMINPEIMGDAVWKEIDFSGVPTKEVYKLYQTYKWLEKGEPRRIFRSKHKDLDAWLYETGKVSVLIDVYYEELEKSEAEKIAEEMVEKQETLEDILKRLKELREGMEEDIGLR